MDAGEATGTSTATSLQRAARRQPSATARGAGIDCAAFQGTPVRRIRCRRETAPMSNPEVCARLRALQVKVAAGVCPPSVGGHFVERRHLSNAQPRISRCARELKAVVNIWRRLVRSRQRRRCPLRTSHFFCNKHPIPILFIVTTSPAPCRRCVTGEAPTCWPRRPLWDTRLRAAPQPLVRVATLRARGESGPAAVRRGRCGGGMRARAPAAGAHVAHADADTRRDRLQRTVVH